MYVSIQLRDADISALQKRLRVVDKQMTAVYNDKRECEVRIDLHVSARLKESMKEAPAKTIKRKSEYKENTTKNRINKTHTQTNTKHNTQEQIHQHIAACAQTSLMLAGVESSLEAHKEELNLARRNTKMLSNQKSVLQKEAAASAQLRRDLSEVKEREDSVVGRMNEALSLLEEKSLALQLAKKKVATQATQLVQGEDSSDRYKRKLASQEQMMTNLTQVGFWGRSLFSMLSSEL